MRSPMREEERVPLIKERQRWTETRSETQQQQQQQQQQRAAARQACLLLAAAAWLSAAGCSSLAVCCCSLAAPSPLSAMSFSTPFPMPKNTLQHQQHQQQQQQQQQQLATKFPPPPLSVLSSQQQQQQQQLQQRTAPFPAPLGTVGAAPLGAAPLGAAPALAASASHSFPAPLYAPSPTASTIVTGAGGSVSGPTSAPHATSGAFPFPFRSQPPHSASHAATPAFPSPAAAFSPVLPAAADAASTALAVQLSPLNQQAASQPPSSSGGSLGPHTPAPRASSSGVSGSGATLSGSAATSSSLLGASPSQLAMRSALKKSLRHKPMIEFLLKSNILTRRPELDRQISVLADRARQPPHDGYGSRAPSITGRSDSGSIGSATGAGAGSGHHRRRPSDGASIGSVASVSSVSSEVAELVSAQWRAKASERSVKALALAKEIDAAMAAIERDEREEAAFDAQLHAQMQAVLASGGGLGDEHDQQQQQQQHQHQQQQQRYSEVIGV